MIKKSISLTLVLILSVLPVFGQRLKTLVKKDSAPVNVEIPKQEEKKGYSSTITKDAKSSKGLIDIHMVKNLLYLEIPKEIMGKPMLFGAKVSQTSDNKDVIAGQMPSDPILVEWSYDDEKVYLHNILGKNICEGQESIYEGFKNNNISPILKAFPIKCYNGDSTKIVIDVTKYFCSDEKPLSPFIPASPFDALFGLNRMKGSFKADMSSIVSFKSFPQNFVISSRLAFSVSDQPFTAVVTASMVLLPKEPMKPRYSDSRVGYFTDTKQVFTTKEDHVKNLKFINRWNLEPKEEDVERHRRGELVEPKKQIVYYLDPAFPKEWRQYMKEGIEDWQMAFEKIGFKNAIVAKDYPTNDPDFNPDDIRYSCIRYASSGTANAMGPSWTDPRSGEIIQGSVYVYHNVLSLLHNWRFIQTSTVDPKARERVFGMDVMGPLLRYLIVHEVGHTLGLMHNMRGSYAYPVDSLRSPSFTAKNGTTSSIMDYARYNYVAQPGDGVTYFLPPRIGPYDMYAIKFGYARIYEAKTPEEELPVINNWLKEKCNDPIYKFGEQAIFDVTDPSAQTEAIGDDAIKASYYGIQNLKMITNNLLAWTYKEGENYDFTARMYNEVQKQFQRYIGHCMVYLGGSYINYTVKGDNQKESEPVSKKKQKEALKFIIDQINDYPNWVKNKTLLDQLTLEGDNVSDFQSRTMRNLLSPTRLGKIGTLAKFSADPYTQKEYLKDIYTQIWDKTIKGASLSSNDKLMQYLYLHSLLGALDMLPNEPVKSKDLTSIDDQIEVPYFRQSEVERNMTISTKESDVRIMSKPFLYTQLQDLNRLLSSRVMTSVGEQKEHYQYLLFELKKLMK